MDDVTDLVAWLRAQLDDDERIARGATEPGYFYSEGHSANVAAFLDRWNPDDPTFVLADVDAKRRIIDELDAMPHYAWDGRPEYGCPMLTDPDTWAEVMARPQVCDCGRDTHVERSLRLLALPYAGRPGYLEEWRP